MYKDETGGLQDFCSITIDGSRGLSEDILQQCLQGASRDSVRSCSRSRSTSAHRPSLTRRSSRCSADSGRLPRSMLYQLKSSRSCTRADFPFMCIVLPYSLGYGKYLGLNDCR